MPPVPSGKKDIHLNVELMHGRIVARPFNTVGIALGVSKQMCRCLLHAPAKRSRRALHPTFLSARERRRGDGGYPYGCLSPFDVLTCGSYSACHPLNTALHLHVGSGSPS